MESHSISSNELNFLVFRYLQESGFTHSAFALGYEAGINKSSIDGNFIPPGALVTFVQKGLRYVELEANLNDADGDDCFSFLQPLELITKGVSELRELIKDRKTDFQKKRKSEKEKVKDREHRREKDKQAVEKEKEKEKEKENGREKGKEKAEKSVEKDKQEVCPEKEFPRDREDKVKIKSEDGVTGVPESMETYPDVTSASSIEFSRSDVTILEGHTSEVFSCAWNPKASFLASGSGDSTARIWTIPSGHSASILRTAPPNSVILKHFKGRSSEKSKDVTTLDWNIDGTLLATGSYDGNARIWNIDGDLKGTLVKHKGPIFSLKWNRKCDCLISGSVDKTVIAWDLKSGHPKQQFDFHSAPTLDVDWRNNVSFATCSTDSMIYYCKLGESRPLKAFIGHQGEVNAIKWDPSGSLLASCSDDMTAKIWSLKQESWVYDFKDHQKEIYTIRWSPTGPGTVNPNQQLILASASFDSTVKLWDVDAGKLISTLSGHSAAVYSISFSPNGEYLASGSVDQSLQVWSVKEGKIVRSFRAAAGGIFEVCWNREGDKIAASFANSTVCVLDFRL